MAEESFFDSPPQSSGSYTSSIGSPLGGGDSARASSEAQSTSEPISVESRQTDWGLLQSQLLSMLGNQQYQWAMQQYAKGEGVTDQTIANFLEMSGKGKGLADTLINQYQDQFKPLMDQYIRDAGSYASEERQAFEAGKAMSTVAQADTAAINEMERKLGGLGVNVNSGRYQDMMLSARTQDAAARAQAGTQAAQATEDRGRAMTEKAIAMGQNIPGQAMNAVQSAYAGLTGAENAVLGLMNSGANLAQSAAPFFQAAVGANKIPPTGQLSQSTNQSQGPAPQGGGASGGGGGGKPKESGGGQPKAGGEKGGGKGGGGKGEGEGGGGGGSKGGGAVRTGDNYGKDIPVAKSTDDERAGTGDPTPGYMGDVPYIDPNTGGVLPQWSPDLARDPATGDLYGPDTPQWDQPGVSNWTTPEMPGTGYNTGPSTTGAQEYPGVGTNLPMGWSDPFSTGGESPWDTESPANAQLTSGDAQDQWGGQDFGDFNEQNEFGGDYSGSEDQWGGQDFGDYSGGDYDFSDADYGGGYDDYGGGYDDYGSYASGDDTYGGGYEDDYGGYDDYGQYASGEDTYGGGYEDDYGGGYDDYSYDDYGGGYDDYSYDDYGGGYDDYSSYASGEDTYGGGYGEEYYARGGAVRPRGQRPGQRPRPRPPQRGGVMPTSGGSVPRSASPSRGRQTDDISARLNAGEYVIPRDVVSHKGTEFFTKMIQNSRKLRTGMAGAKPKPTMKPGLPAGGRPGFSSRPMPLPRR